MNREVFRLAPPLILWWVWVAFAVANIADFAIQVSALLVTVTGLAYALALRPRVIADQAGLTIVNPFRDHDVPWAAIQAVGTGEWVQVHCAPDRVISSWALYISARTKRRAARVTGSPGSAAAASQSGYAASSRLPEEARYLASLPPAKAIAVRLDVRASRERARAGATGSGPVIRPATARWAWPPLVAVALPVLALLITLLA